MTARSIECEPSDKAYSRAIQVKTEAITSYLQLSSSSAHLRGTAQGWILPHIHEARTTHERVGVDTALHPVISLEVPAHLSTRRPRPVSRVNRSQLDSAPCGSRAVFGKLRLREVRLDPGRLRQVRLRLKWCCLVAC